MQETIERKAEIMRVTTELLLSNSYAKVNMSTIAESCGITKAGIYYHFKNKEELIRECLKSSLTNLNSILYSHCTESVTVRDKLHKISEDLYSLGKENPGLLVLFLRSISEPEMRTIFATLHDQVDLFMQGLGEIIRFGLGSGEVVSTVDPFMAARMLTGTFLMQLQHTVLLGKDEKFNPGDAVDMLFDGISPR